MNHNRTIKFRAWDGTQMHWLDYLWNDHFYNAINGGRPSLDNTNKSAGRLFDSGNLILMQFTGLYDKEGVDIYEGDIVEFLNDYTSDIFFKNGCFINRKSGWNLGIFLKSDGNSHNECFKVIGNIHQHPNLLTNQ